MPASSSCHPAALPTEQLLQQCEVRRLRRSGPGGQHRNKVETAVALRHHTGVTAEANERRSQLQNQAQALHRLRINLALEIRSPVGAGTSPSELWRSRCRNGRISISPTHADFPALLAEALDVAAASDNDVSAAADRLDVTLSQLVKLLKLEPRALQWINTRRAAAGLHRLR